MVTLADEEQNPYVILGVPFGASRDVATAAFALKAFDLDHEADEAVLTRLTWALNQIEEVVKDPETALHLYRVPADLGATEPDDYGILHPLPERMNRATLPDDHKKREILEIAIGEALIAAAADYSSTFGLVPR